MYKRPSFNPHTILFTLCLYIKYNNFIISQCFLQCFRITETKFTCSATLGYNVLVHKSQQICPHTLLDTLCQYIRYNNSTLSHCWFHSFSISGTNFYYHPLLVARCQVIRDNIFTTTAAGYTVCVYHRQKFNST